MYFFLKSFSQNFSQDSQNEMKTCLKCIKIILRCNLVMKLLISLQLAVHIVDGSYGQKIHLADMHAKLNRP